MVNRSLAPYAVVLVICLAAIIALSFFRVHPISAISEISTASSKAAVLDTLAGTAKTAQLPPSPVVDAVAKIEPSVVTVHIEGKPVIVNNNPFGNSPMFNDPFFRQFFGDQGLPFNNQPEQYTPKAAGSGVIISPDGYILTNNHVVQDAAHVTVEINGKGQVAQVVGTDPISDIAVVKVNTHGQPLTAAALGDSSRLKVGDWAIAVGNPLDIGTTVTLGIISAVNRRSLSDEGNPLAGTIQTDAAINPGNSGGALANIDGQVIGINEAIVSPTGSSIGIGFAIPINTARQIAKQLILRGHVSRPYLGVAFAPLRAITAPTRKSFGINVSGDEGVVVNKVYPGSPAAAAGIRKLDVILKANGDLITESSDLNDLIQSLNIGDRLTLSISRHGHMMTIVAQLKERPATYGISHEQEEPMPGQIP